MSTINPQIFRQYDIRGVAGRDLTDETVELLGKAFGVYVKESGSNKVLVGRDNRISSGRLREAITRGLVTRSRCWLPGVKPKPRMACKGFVRF